MTQEEHWFAMYNEIMAFMAKNHQRPSKYYLEERNNWNWMLHFYREGIRKDSIR